MGKQQSRSSFIKDKKKQTSHYVAMVKLLMLSLLIAFLSCKEKKPQRDSREQGRAQKLQYARGFKITDLQQYKKIEIYNPDDTNTLISEFKIFPRDYKGKLQGNQLRVPCSKIICLSSTQLAYFIELKATDRITGLNSSRFLFNEKVRGAIKNGEIKRVGKEGNFNTELIAGINPDVILVSPFKTGGYDAIKNLGIPLLPVAAYNEALPLGRAEWIKLISVLTGQEKQADSVFNTIQRSYNHLKQLTSNIKHKPTVFSGKLKSGSWYVPGGNSFIACILRDAGADYIYKDNNRGAYPLSFEAVYNKAHNADFWRLQVSEPGGFNHKLLALDDARYADFNAFKQNKILVCNIREKAYYEENPVKPHIILADFICLFHPDLLPAYQPVYYEFLK